VVPRIVRSALHETGNIIQARRREWETVGLWQSTGGRDAPVDPRQRVRLAEKFEALEDRRAYRRARDGDAQRLRDFAQSELLLLGVSFHRRIERRGRPVRDVIESGP